MVKYVLEPVLLGQYYEDGTLTFFLNSHYSLAQISETEYVTITSYKQNPHKVVLLTECTWGDEDAGNA